MSLEIVRGIEAHLAPDLKQQLTPRLKSIKKPEAAQALIEALDQNQKPTGFTDKHWAGLQAAYLAYLEAVTGSTPLPNLKVVAPWTGDLSPIRDALTKENGPFHHYGPLFWAALERHCAPHAQVEALVRGGIVDEEIMGALPRGAHRSQILSLLGNVLKGSPVAAAK